MKGVNVFFAEGFEPIEALTVVDVLSRGGVNVNQVSISDDLAVSGCHGVNVLADVTLEELIKETRNGAEGTLSNADVMVFPGGLPGASNLASDELLMSLLREHYAQGGSVAAICAAPGLVLPSLGDAVDGLRFTCYDGFENNLIPLGGVFDPVPAVVDKRIITGRGPGCALQFALAVLAHIKGQAVADGVAAGMLIP